MNRRFWQKVKVRKGPGSLVFHHLPSFDVSIMYKRAVQLHNISTVVDVEPQCFSGTGTSSTYKSAEQIEDLLYVDGHVVVMICMSTCKRQTN